MCLIALIKFALKFLLPVAIIILVIWLVYGNKGEDAGALMLHLLGN